MLTGSCRLTASDGAGKHYDIAVHEWPMTVGNPCASASSRTADRSVYASCVPPRAPRGSCTCPYRRFGESRSETHDTIPVS